VVVVGGSHVFVGLGEALLTAGILAMVWRARPELAAALPAVGASRRWAWAGTGAAAALAVLAAYFASTSPDVLESAAARFGLREAVIGRAPFPGYESLALAPWLIALAGVIAVFLFAYLLLRAVAQR
jgi:hypothetical protein